MSRKNKKLFEIWRDRIFSILIPILFAYILIFENQTNQTIKIILLILLLGFATGQSALLGRHIVEILINFLGGKNHGNESRKKDDKNNN